MIVGHVLQCKVYIWIFVLLKLWLLDIIL